MNPWQAKAKGCPCMAVLVYLYCNDTSGNKGKKWNKHHSWVFTMTGLPRKEALKEYNVHFLSVSNIAPPLEMPDGIVDQ
ncbi:hypothetical protein FA13DRAFT_1631817 [Coprinellus micaceus]|uniref:Uncharacterized protein n=1 Tax=Coprinellus micaceus TaxID=71717 RepID=A0A4Y7T7L9_COPMI|nr:hypothetical protein FA13DRAFT_1631817 [Coprinellus micaceus]